MQISEINSLFNNADTNSDGYISASEMKKIINNTTDTTIQTLFSSLKTNNNKFSSKNFKILSQGDNKLTREELLNMLSYDKDDESVVLSSTEQTAMNNNIYYVSQIDTNGDGKMTSKEILTAYNKAVKENNQALKNLLEPYMTTNKKGKKIVNNDTFKALSSTVAEETTGKGRDSRRTETVRAMTMSDMMNFDNDKNSTLSTTEQTEQTNFQTFFYTMDKNKNGKITAAEIVKTYNEAASNSDLKNMLEVLVTTTNGKTKINSQKFKELSSGKNYIQLKDLSSLDKDLNGSVSADEITALITNKTKEFESLDKNKNGQITFNEVKNSVNNIDSDALIAKLIMSGSTVKEQKQIFKQLSNGKGYITLSDIAKYDTDNDGEFSTAEIEALKKIIKNNLKSEESDDTTNNNTSDNNTQQNDTKTS